MERPKETTVNNKGKFNKKKRFGKSIKNRCPSGFQVAVEEKFKTTGSIYIVIIGHHNMIIQQMNT